MFTPFAPIELPDFFAGRREIIEDIRNELAAPGRQVAVYGERGVGKTSLALLLYFFAGYDDDHVHIFRCDDGTTFDDIFGSLLIDAGHGLGVNGAQAESSQSAEGRVGPVAGGLSRRTTVSYRAVRDAQAITLSRVLAAFGNVRKLLIIDEFDRVQDAQTKTRMAELIKQFSDARSETKIVVVGVAETLTALIGQHESLSRSLAQIGLQRMAEPELADIIERGSQRIEARFDPRVALRIVRLADGFPHFVHLLCLYASLYTGDILLSGQAGRPHVGEREYQLGLKSAISKCEHSLREVYEAAVVTTRRKSDIYELTLRAMALSESRDVQVRELAEHASQLVGDPLPPEKFSNALGELVKRERGRILTKVRAGYYKYTNPLMRAYIRLLLEFDNVTQYGGQMEFAFMRGA
ncbi:MAG: ATP-binding protein [Planctomycetota bacterium]